MATVDMTDPRTCSDSGEGYTQILANCLDALDVPEQLRRQLDRGPAFPAGQQLWPPRPGCSASPDGARVRIWARLDLAQWIEGASNVFGPHRAGELDGLLAVGARLRIAGEGANVLWGIDVVPVEQWVTHRSVGLAVAELICCGPRLADDLVNEIDAQLTRIGWWYTADRANQRCVVNRTPCFETAWHEGNTRSSWPAAPASRDAD